MSLLCCEACGSTTHVESFVLRHVVWLTRKKETRGFVPYELTVWLCNECRGELAEVVQDWLTKKLEMRDA